MKYGIEITKPHANISRLEVVTYSLNTMAEEIASVVILRATRAVISAGGDLNRETVFKIFGYMTDQYGDLRLTPDEQSEVLSVLDRIYPA